MVTDNSGVPPSLTPNRQSGSYFSAPGLYEVIYWAADSSGNVATCSFRITLKSKWKVCVGRHIAISTQSSSVHVEERDRERIPKPVSTGVENATHEQSTPYLSSLLPFQKFRCSRNFSTGTSRKVVFYLLSNRLEMVNNQNKFNTNLHWIGLWYLLYCYLHVFLNWSLMCSYPLFQELITGWGGGEGGGINS